MAFKYIRKKDAGCDFMFRLLILSKPALQHLKVFYMNASVREPKNILI